MQKKQETIDPNRIKFIATLPPTESAIKIHGQEGMRITFDIPESEVLRGEVLRLLLLRGKQMEVEIHER